MQLSIPSDYRYRFTGHERVLHNCKRKKDSIVLSTCSAINACLLFAPGR
jgi:hypothetical protein